MNRPGETLLSRIARWNLDLSFQDLPEPVVGRARCQLMSVLASVYAGRVLKESSSVLQAVRTLHRGTESTLLVTGEKASVEGAILGNASLSMAHDYDDYLFMGHTGHSAVLGSLALCEAYGKRVSDLITCQVAANELAGRLGASALLGPLNGQMWSFIHLLAGASVAGRALGLSPGRMEHAVAIALSQPPYPSFSGFFASGTKLLTASWPTVLGVQAAFFAAHGMTGPEEILDGTSGFYRTFSYYPIRGAWDGLGQRWLTESLAVKRHPGCAYLDSAVDALGWILERFCAERGRPLRPAEVERIHVSATLLTCEMERLSRQWGPGDHPVSMNFSLRKTLAWRILKGGLDAETLTEQALRESAPAVRELADRITIAPDLSWNRDVLASLADRACLGDLLREMGVRGIVSLVRKASAQYGFRKHLPGVRQLWESLRPSSTLNVRLPRRAGPLVASRRSSRRGGRAASRFSLSRVVPEELEFPFASTVEVLLRDGTRLRREQRVPVGAPGNHDRALHEVAREKFRKSAEGLLGHERTERALGALETLAPDQRVSDLVPLLAPR